MAKKPVRKESGQSKLVACTLRVGGSRRGERQTHGCTQASTFGVDWKCRVTERTHQKGCQVSRMSIWAVLGAIFREEDQRWESSKREERALTVHFLNVCDISEISKEKYQQTDEYTCLGHRD